VSRSLAVGSHVTASFVVVACLVAVMLGLPSTALGASPSPSRPASTDTRSPLEGPGFVGAPLAAIVAVLGIAVLAVLVTMLYVRLTSDRSQPPDPPSPGH
jgi:hypothetical protein